MSVTTSAAPGQLQLQGHFELSMPSVYTVDTTVLAAFTALKDRNPVQAIQLINTAYMSVERNAQPGSSGEINFQTTQEGIKEVRREVRSLVREILDNDDMADKVKSEIKRLGSGLDSFVISSFYEAEIRRNTTNFINGENGYTRLMGEFIQYRHRMEEQSQLIIASALIVDILRKVNELNQTESDLKSQFISDAVDIIKGIGQLSTVEAGKFLRQLSNETIMIDPRDQVAKASKKLNIKNGVSCPSDTESFQSALVVVGLMNICGILTPADITMNGSKTKPLVVDVGNLALIKGQYVIKGIQRLDIPKEIRTVAGKELIK